MLRASFLVALFLAAAVPAPDDRTADFDPKMDFSQFKTLALSINTFSEGTLVVDVLRRPVASSSGAAFIGMTKVTRRSSSRNIQSRRSKHRSQR